MSYFALILPYLIGAFPTGYLLAKYYKINIKKEGSGSVGATNVARTIGKKAGIITLVVDVLKGFLAVTLATTLFESNTLVYTSAFLVVLGHCCSIPPFLKGGKGVATALGVLLAGAPLLAIWAVSVFIVVFYVSRIVSLSSIAATASGPIFSYILTQDILLTVSLTCICILIIFKHSANIKRLFKKEEPKFTPSSSPTRKIKKTSNKS